MELGNLHTVCSAWISLQVQDQKTSSDYSEHTSGNPEPNKVMWTLFSYHLEPSQWEGITRYSCSDAQLWLQLILTHLQ